jgi:hypothetical protein
MTINALEPLKVYTSSGEMYTYQLSEIISKSEAPLLLPPAKCQNGEKEV